jgi:hypothetical protein
MHFNQNRKASQAVGRGYSRSWFVSIDVRDPATSVVTPPDLPLVGLAA